MKIFVPEKLNKLAELCPENLYIVGGYVRNALGFGVISEDVDIAGDLSFGSLSELAEKIGFRALAFYKTTGTGVLSDGERKYEFARFRTEKYERGGGHTPAETENTSDVTTDALRRDFKCNAVYYDIKNGKIVDPLGGVEDIKARVLDTVRPAAEVFSRDGLRLMRLARFAAETGFTPTKAVLTAAKTYAHNITDISAERIYCELNKILVADVKYPFSPKDGHYRGLKILDETRVLDELFPELTEGRGMSQRSDYHNHDVLEHSLRAALYADADIRLAALLHDIGKPFAMKKYDSFSRHAEYGAKIAEIALERLKTDKKTVKETVFLVKEHYRDTDCTCQDRELRRFFADNLPRLDKLFRLKTADHYAHKDDLSACPSVVKWRKLLCKMKSDGTPFSVRELKITAAELKKIGYTGKEIGEELDGLRRECVDEPKLNARETLEALAIKNYESRR